jgi:hypothetical protein
VPRPPRPVLALGSLLLVIAIVGPAAAADKEEERPAERIPGVKSRVFEVKHRSPEDLIRVLRPLGSGVKGTAIAESGEFHTITVRDFPENIASIEDALKRLDVPSPPKPDIEVQMRVLIATPTGATQVPADLASVVKQLHASLSYKGYYHIDDILGRVRNGHGLGGRGSAPVTQPASPENATLNYQYGLKDVVIVSNPGKATTVQIRELFFKSSLKPLGDAEIYSGLTLREGDKVVVAKSSLKDRALILILSVKVVR